MHLERNQTVVPCHVAGQLMLAAGLWVTVAGTAWAHFPFLTSDTAPARDASSWEAVLTFTEGVLFPGERLPERIAASSTWLRTGPNERHRLELTRTERRNSPVMAASLDQAAPCAIESHCDYGIYQTFRLTYFAKHLRSGADRDVSTVSRTPEAELDLQPRFDGDRVVVTAWWRDQPREGVKITVTDGAGQQQSLTTDAAGEVQWKEGEQPTAAVVANLVDSNARGELDGAEFRGSHYYTTLTWLRNSPRESTADRPIPTLWQPLASFGAAAVGGRVYVYGGHLGQEHEHTIANVSDEFRSYDPTTGGEWTKLASRGPRQGLALVADTQSLYLVGGMSARNQPHEPEDLNSSAEVWRFDPRSGEWAALPSLPAPRSSHDAMVLGERLYVVGGWALSGPGEGDWHKDAWVLDLKQTDHGWQKLADPPFVKRALACAEYRGQLVAIGGMNADHTIDRSVWIYQPATNQWREGPVFPGEGMNGFGAAAWNESGRLLASGSDGNVYELSDDGTSWVQRGTLATPRFFHRFVPVGRSLWVIGGASHTAGHLDNIELLQVAP